MKNMVSIWKEIDRSEKVPWNSEQRQCWSNPTVWTIYKTVRVNTKTVVYIAKNYINLRVTGFAPAPPCDAEAHRRHREGKRAPALHHLRATPWPKQRVREETKSVLYERKCYMFSEITCHMSQWDGGLFYFPFAIFFPKSLRHHFWILTQEA